MVITVCVGFAFPDCFGLSIVSIDLDFWVSYVSNIARMVRGQYETSQKI